MNSNRKGQESISNVFTFAATIILSIMLLIIMTSSENLFEGQTDVHVKFETEQVNTRSLMTTVLEDHIWRVADNGTISFTPGDYENRKVGQLLSIYFSTPGDTIYFGRNEVSKENMKANLTTYLKYKLDRYLVKNTGNPADYTFKTEYEDRSIEVQNLNNNQEGEWYRTTTNIAVSDGENAEAVLWVRTDSSIYDITGDAVQ